MVPHLITALTGPINELEQRMLDSMPAIERWFRLEWMEHTPPFYTSVDMRNAGFKLAPVDTNLFPGGWNNLTPEMLPLAVQAAMAAIEKICPEAKNLLLIPENHTRNTFYLSNVAAADAHLHMAGLNVRLGSLTRTSQGPHPGGPARRQQLLEPLLRTKRPAGAEGLRPLHHPAEQRPVGRRAGHPGRPARAVPAAAAACRLERAPQEPALPELRRSGQEVRQAAGHGPLADQPDVRPVRRGDFDEGTGLDCLQTNVDALLTKVRRKYKEYGINEKPFVVVKADNGTYGMGIMTVRDAKDLDEAEPPHPGNKMAVVKDGQEVTQVIIQEGVPTYERMNDAVAEPVVYMMDRYVVGGFYRIHAERGVDENLNAPGASFVPLAFAESHHLPSPARSPAPARPTASTCMA
jgi:glutamate--cysteine ligase